MISRSEGQMTQVSLSMYYWGLKWIIQSCRLLTSVEFKGHRLCLFTYKPDSEARRALGRNKPGKDRLLLIHVSLAVVNQHVPKLSLQAPH